MTVGNKPRRYETKPEGGPDVLFAIYYKNTGEYGRLSFMNTLPPFTIDTFSMPQSFSKMISKLKVTNVVWLPCKFAKNASHLDPHSDKG